MLTYPAGGGQLRDNVALWVSLMAVLMLISYPFLPPAIAGMLNLMFVVACTVLGLRKWGLIAAGYTIFITWVMDLLFWHKGFGLDVYLLGTLTNLAVVLIFGSVLEQKNRLALTDGLSGLYNHRYMHEFLNWEVQKSDRYGRQLTLLILDIDDFKHYNDQFGHQFGDRVLQHVADVLGKSVRKTDIVARCGGDEFAVIMPETAADDSLGTIGRIAANLAQRPLKRGGEEIHVTVSIGGSSMEPGKSKDALFNEADRALACAKREGKNTAFFLSGGNLEQVDSTMAGPAPDAMAPEKRAS